MLQIDRITFNPNVMGGKACIRGMRITVSVVLNLLAHGMTKDEILSDYPYLEEEDIIQCNNYASHLINEKRLQQAIDEMESEAYLSHKLIED